MTFIDTLHIITILVVKVKVVPFGLAHFQVLFPFSFGVYIFVSPLIFLLGLFTLFLAFYYFFIFFKIWENNLQKARYVRIYQTIKFNSKFMNPIIIGP